MYKSVVVACLSVLLFAGAPQAREVTIHSLMSQIGQEMTAIYPLVYAERELSAQQIKALSTGLERMTGLFAQVGPEIRGRSVTYGVSYDYMGPYLKEMTAALRAKKTEYALGRLYGIGSICTSCHTQDTHLRTMFPGTTRDAFASDLVYAEFNFMTRDYQTAELYYDKYLTNKTHKTESQILKPLRRLITIYVQIYNRPGDAAKLLSRYETLSDHTRVTKAALQGWTAGLAALEKKNAKRVAEPDFKSLENEVKQTIGELDQPPYTQFVAEDAQIPRIWLRGQIFHYLNRKPAADEIPKLLFWLAISDRSTGNNLYFSPADMYLKYCVKHYAKHPYAKMCYAEYKDYVTSEYSGSAGTFLPDEIEDELVELHKLVKGAK